MANLHSRLAAAAAAGVVRLGGLPMTRPLTDEQEARLLWDLAEAGYARGLHERTPDTEPFTIDAPPVVRPTTGNPRALAFTRTRAEVLGIGIRRKLRAMREAAGMTQEEVAHATGMSTSEQWSRVENGRRKLTVEEFALALYALRGVDLRDVMTE